MTLNNFTDLIIKFIGIGFSMSVVLSFLAWSIMKVWRLFTDLTKL